MSTDRYIRDPALERDPHESRLALLKVCLGIYELEGAADDPALRFGVGSILVHVGNQIMSGAFRETGCTVAKAGFVEMLQQSCRR